MRTRRRKRWFERRLITLKLRSRDLHGNFWSQKISRLRESQVRCEHIMASIMVDLYL
jgi:hypothetical protein